MTFDYEITLLKRVVILNKYHEEKISFDENKILACIESISMKEFYEAKNNNLKVDLNFVIHSFEYEGQEELFFDNKKYKVVRTYKRKDGYLELTCEELILIE